MIINIELLNAEEKIENWTEEEGTE